MRALASPDKQRRDSRALPARLFEFDLAGGRTSRATLGDASRGVSVIVVSLDFQEFVYIFNIYIPVC